MTPGEAAGVAAGAGEAGEAAGVAAGSGDAPSPNAPPPASTSGSEEAFTLDLLHFADSKSAGEVVEAVALFRGDGADGAASAAECEWALELVEQFAVRRRPAEVAELVAELSALGQTYDVCAVLETAARGASPGDVVALRGLLPQDAAERLIELFAAHRPLGDVAALLQAIAGPRGAGVRDARPWAEGLAREVLRHAAAGTGRSADARGYGVARLLMLLRHLGLDDWAAWLIEHATPPHRPVEALSGLATALEAFQPGAEGLPDTVWERLEPREFVSLVARTWPDPVLPDVKAAGRDRILGGALAREPAALQAVHAGLSREAPHLARWLADGVAAGQLPGYIADFADRLRREDSAAVSRLVRVAAGSRTGEVLGELVQLWKGLLRSDNAAMRQLLSAIAREASGAAVGTAVRYLTAHDRDDLAADVVEEVAACPQRFTGAELATLLTLVRRERRQTRISRTLARTLAVAYEGRTGRPRPAAEPARPGTAATLALTRAPGVVDSAFLADYVQGLRGVYEDGVQRLDDAVVSTGRARLVRDYARELAERGEHDHARRVAERTPI